jgi:hypothetical protein
MIDFKIPAPRGIRRTRPTAGADVHATEAPAALNAQA